MIWANKKPKPNIKKQQKTSKPHKQTTTRPKKKFISFITVRPTNSPSKSFATVLTAFPWTSTCLALARPGTSVTAQEQREKK